MSFNRNIFKQAHEDVFSRKTIKAKHSDFLTIYQLLKLSPKILKNGIAQQTELDEHLEKVICKIHKTVDVIWKLNIRVPKFLFLNIDKLFVRSPLDFGDIIYDQAYDESHLKIG